MPRSKRTAERLLTAAWQARGALAIALLPLALVFALLAALRRGLFRVGLRQSTPVGVPVVVVGNIVAGGVGKTPLVIHLCHQLAARGRTPGVVARGYGASAAPSVPLLVQTDTPASVCGDEPLLVRRRTGVPVCVSPNRVAAAQALRAAHPEVDVIVSDDGLQHLALARDVEIVLFDARGIMNGWPLPAGPLREPVSRLARVDAIVGNGCAVSPRLCFGWPVFRMDVAPGDLYPLAGGQPLSAAAFIERFAGQRIHAVAGIGDPQRFFDLLSSLGIAAVPHAFGDHHAYTDADLALPADVIVATEKDAVKFSNNVRASAPVWVLPIDARLTPDLAALVLEKMDGRPTA